MADVLHDQLAVVLLTVLALAYLVLVGFLAYLAMRPGVRRPVRILLAIGTILGGLVPIISAFAVAVT
jgi:hypothetical protein